MLILKITIFFPSSIDLEVLQGAAFVTFSCWKPVETFLAWLCILAIKMPPEMSS